MALDTAADQKTFDWEDPLDLASRLSEDERMVWDSARSYAREKLLPRVVSAFAEERFDEGRRLRGNDSIAVTAQSSHAGGRPMSQRECAGFNWPPLSIPAEEPVSISPDAVSRAGPHSVACLGN